MRIDEGQIRRVVLTEIARGGKYKYVPAGISNRHVHLSSEDLARLFGPGHGLCALREVSQPGQYAANETVTLVGKKGRIENVRVLGPVRAKTQVEVSISDAFALGIKGLKVRLSGDLEGTSGIRIIGPAGEIELSEGLIIAARHLHMSPDQANAYGLKDREVVSLKYKGARSVVFNEVICRVGEGHELEFHMDTDEANAAGISPGALLEVICENKKSCHGTCSKHGTSGCKGNCESCISKKSAAALSNGDSGISGAETKPCEDTKEEPLELITERDIFDARSAGKDKVLLAPKGIVTPAAADRAGDFGIEIVCTKGGHR